MSNLYFTICGLFCSILIVILFYSKEKLDSPETKLYGIMIVSGLIDTALVSLILFIAYVNFNPLTNLFIIMLNKIDFLHYILWPSLAFLYTLYISYNNLDLYNRAKKIVIPLDIIFYVIDLFLPIHTIKENNIMGIVGTGADFVYAIAIIYIFLIFVLVVKNFKKGNKQKFIPLAVLVLLLIVASVVRLFNPTLLVIPAILVYINLIMYFTIENPDVKLIEELVKAQKLSEKTNNDKSTFVYTISEDIGNRLDNAEIVYNNVMAMKPNEEIADEMRTLKEVITGARTMLINAFGISENDNKHLGLTNNKYNINLLLDSIYTAKKKEVNENTQFRLNVSEDLPKELYGDSIKLKQILNTIIDNSIKYTKEGTIELRVNSIIKNNICRLIMSVEDSGSGIDIFKQNEIMTSSSELTEEDISQLNEMNLNLKIVRKMISLIGGTFTIDNNKFGGTTINISIDQRIVENVQSKEEKQIAKYSETINNQKTCAIISLNKDAVKIIKSASKKENYKIYEFDVCKDALDNIRQGINYNVIFIDEFMDKIDARSFLSKIKKVEGIDSKVIVISKYKELKNKKELLDLGFTNVVVTPLDKKDVLSKLENL